MKLSTVAIYFATTIMVLSTYATASIVINEMEMNPPEGGADWVEIFNSGNDSADISGWTVTVIDNGWVGKFPLVPSGTIIPAKGFYFLDGQSSWNHDNGGYATLYTASGEIVDKSANREDTLNNDFTYGRHPDGYDTNMDGDWGLGSATKGRSNVR
jgi:hypothetical protein